MVRFEKRRTSPLLGASERALLLVLELDNSRAERVVALVLVPCLTMSIL